MTTSPQYAGFWLRFSAVIIDLILFFVISLAYRLLVLGMEDLSSGVQLNWYMNIGINYILPAGVTIWFWLRFLGRPGKLLCNIIVVDASSLGPMSVGQAIGRYFAYILAILPLLLGFIWIAFDPQNRGFHDIVANTLVIKNLNTVGKQPQNHE
ncbi:MAG: RDD family protein [Paraglaciecola sp.]|nr:RDD family protein [Paraglaciecola sp.]NCT49473.1 RDD family protein [Paraglaciecola sp.]